MPVEDHKKEVFTNLYNDNSDSVFRFCLFRVSDREAALDLMEDAFMKFWDYFRKNDDLNNERAFLFKITRNLIIDYYRKKRSLRFGEDEDIANDVRFSHNLVEVAVEAREVIEKIGLLDNIYRESVYMRLVEGMRPKEIAGILGESENNISVRVNRGVKKLRKILKDGK